MIQHVVRGGIATPWQLEAGTGHSANGFGFSVQTAPGVSVDELAAGGQFRNGQISVTTVGRLADAGFSIRFPTPGRGAHHGTVLVPYPAGPQMFQVLSSVFVTRRNPHVLTNR